METKHRYVYQVTPLTAVHIGTGDSYDPMQYTMKKETQSGKFSIYRYDALSVMEGMDTTQKKELERILDAGDFRKACLFVAGKAREEQCRYTGVVSPEVFKDYITKQQDPANQLTVDEMYRTPGKDVACLPGSSLKGAIRTAVLEKEADSFRNKAELEQLIRDRRGSRNFEPVVFGFRTKNRQGRFINDVQKDPFRGIRFTDGIISAPDPCLVFSIENYRPGRDSPFAAMHLWVESLWGQFLGGKTKAAGEMTIDSGLLQQRALGAAQFFRSGHKDLVSQLLQACHSFYSNVFETEYDRFYAGLAPNNLTGLVQQLRKYISTKINPEQGEALIRVGRFSQIEAVTINQYRQPWNNKWGNSRMLGLLNGSYFPLGWAKLKLLLMK